MILVVAVIITGCAGAQEESAVPKNAKYKDASLPVDTRIEDLLSYMTIEEKAAQMAQAANYAASPDEVKWAGIGSVLSGGGDHPSGGYQAKDWLEFCNEYQAAAKKSRLGIPILYGFDAVHGDAKIQGATVFPHNTGLGAANDPELVEKIGRITAIEGRAGGVNWNFAPCVAVSRDERWGRSYESFSESPDIASALGAAYVKGLENGDISARSSMAACVKHYFADGGAEWGTGQNGIDRGDCSLSDDELRRIHLAPYISALKENPASVMISFSGIQGEEMHSNKKWIDVLKNELQFKGIIVSDWAGHTELEGNNRFAQCINAGIDMIMLPDNYHSFIREVCKNVKDGVISQERIDEAVTRILKVKFTMGLFENPIADESLLSLVGSDEHFAVAREAVRKSLVLLKNNGSLPLSNGEKIAVVGTKSKDMGVLCGGWMMAWGGYSQYESLAEMLDYNSKQIVQMGLGAKGTTILDAFTERAGSSNIVFSKDGSDIAGVEKAVVVIGEVPYAEFTGDSNDLSISSADVKKIKRVYDQGIPVIAVIISGRPQIISEIEPFCDAVVEAWLPGSMAGPGMADVFFGDYNFSGKLPVAWPKSMDQIPINDGDGKEGLYPLGYGLTY